MSNPKNKDDLQPIIRFKLPKGVDCKALGRYAQRLNFVNSDQYHMIYVDVKRIIEYCKISENFGWDATFDQVFSHVISHEYIHFLLATQIGNTENCTFDILFGLLPDNPKYIYSGVTFEGDPHIIPKRHIYTKLINSIRNKIDKVKNATK